jgi:hypothetical protein
MPGLPGDFIVLIHKARQGSLDYFFCILGHRLFMQVDTAAQVKYPLLRRGYECG